MPKWTKHLSMLAFLNLIRYKNLIIIIVVQWLIKYGLFDSLGVATTLDHLHFILLALATILIAAGGYIINDIYDVRIDKINKPEKVIINKKLSENTANTMYMVFTFLGVVTGFYLSNHIGTPGFAALFILSAALLYMYATFIKSILLVGTLVISVLVTLSLIIIGVFELVPAIDYLNQQIQLEAFSILLYYSFFAFILTFLRETVKDVEDINGDKNGGRQTLPILIGRKRTAIVCFVLAIASTIPILMYMYEFLYRAPWTMLYFLIAVIGPLLYFVVKVFAAETKIEFHHLSNVLKLVMVMGLLSLLFYKFNLL
jgi:4-hydroxybenzoate polyprenyltransferase